MIFKITQNLPMTYSTALTFVRPYNSDNSFLEEFLEEDSIPFRYYKFFEYMDLKSQDILSAYYKRSSELMREYVKYVEKNRR